MFLRPFAACAAALLIPAPVTSSAPQPWSYTDAIPHLICSKPLNDGTGRYSVNGGTGARVSSTLVLTVNHVSGGRACFANGGAAFRLGSRPDLDYAEIYSASGDTASILSVKCVPLTVGAAYWAYGYAAGHRGAIYREIVFYAGQRGSDGSTFSNDAVFLGPESFIPGMSGGPIFDNDGYLVALVQGYASGTPSGTHLSMGRALVDTPYCKGRLA